MKKKAKNSNYKAHFEPQRPPKTLKKSKFMLIFVCIFMAVLVLAGAVFGIALAVKNSKAVVSYNGITLTKEEASFFASYYKLQYMVELSQKGVEVEDTESFWNTKVNELNTYGDFLKYNTRQYLKEIVLCNYFYDNYAKLSKQEKRDIELAIKEVLDYRADGSIDTFNTSAEKMGFSYSIFDDVSELLYKAIMARTAVFGNNGQNLSSETEICEEFLKEYSHVKLMFIRSETDFRYDENGDRFKDDDGNDLLFTLSAQEKEKRREDIEKLTAAVDGAASGGDFQMSPTMFDNYLNVYKSGDDEKDSAGYYFHESSDYTAEFASALSDVVDASLEMKIGEYKKVDLGFGVCFIYKYDVTPGAYLQKSEFSCFDDFYELAAEDKFSEMLEEIGEDVVFSKEYDEFDFIALPKNDKLYPAF